MPLRRHQLRSPDYEHLDRLLQHYRTDGLPTTLVSLMPGNNEIGNLNDIERIGWLYWHHNALFHSDTVQTVGRYVFDLTDLPVDFIVGSAHKFHGPKGVGFLFAHNRIQLPALLYVRHASDRNIPTKRDERT